MMAVPVIHLSVEDNYHVHPLPISSFPSRANKRAISVFSTAIVTSTRWEENGGQDSSKGSLTIDLK